MVLNEKHDEQNKQRWISRATRERLNLSASVEETLEGAPVDEMAWSENLDEQANLPEELPGKGIFPPRLSLQSRPVPALRPDNPVEQPLGSSSESTRERKPTPGTQNTSMLKRFAQRLTSSFAVLGGASSSEIVESTLHEPQGEEARPTRSPETARRDYHTLQSTQSPSEAPAHQEKTDLRRTETASGEELRERQSKQRLAGRTTRIHLETPRTMMPVSARLSEEMRSENAQNTWLQKDNLVDGTSLYKGNEVGGTVDIPPLSSAGSPSSTYAARPSLQVMDQISSRANTTGAHLPAVDAEKGKSNTASRRELSGSGMFEVGQGEATVVNRYVTEASVVLVTLTGNPGPVVVQYVTLRPRIGFTVHLTAPTTMRTSFNYIVLLGELF